MMKELLSKGIQRSMMLIMLFLLSAAAYSTTSFQHNAESNDPTTTSNDFTLVTDASDFDEGDYIIVYDGGAMNTTVSGNRLQCTEVTATDNVITTTETSIIWHIAPSGDYYTVYNASENKYAAANGTKNQVQLLATGTDDKALWSVAKGATFEFVNKHNSANSVNANLRRNGTYGFACYSTSTGGALSLYKRVGSSQPVNPTAAYYQNADGKAGAALKTAMCGIIYNHTELDYADLWTAYQTTDVRSDGTIWDMYSNTTSYDPVSGSHSNSSEGSGFNREHSFPKSWFGGEVMPMYTDLHHLYPVDSYINGMRNNNPYGETDGNSYKSANDFSKLGTCTYPGYTGKVFEPADEYKGDFARTYFYMVTCYEEKLHDWYTNYSSTTEVGAVLDGNTYPGFQDWQLEMLMEWAKNDPVSEKETNRNNAVYSIQGNRNPFIDYPGLEEYIWGGMTNTAFSNDNYVLPVYKQGVTMAFQPATATATLGQDFTEPTLTISPTGLTVTYSSSDPSVATADEDTGLLTLLAAGTTIITATFEGDDTYKTASATYTLTVTDPNLIAGETLLYEGMTGYTSKGDGTNEIAKDNTNLNFHNWSSFTKIFAGGTSNAYSNGGCLKFGSGSTAGSMTTGSIPLTGDGKLTFYLKQYGSDSGLLNVTVTGATADVTTFTPASEWTLCTVNLTNATGDVTITIATSSKRAYVDEITLTANSKLIIVDNGTNSNTISTAAKTGGKYDVTLSGRTLYRDGEWNTLCLPFNLVLMGSPLDGAKAKTLTDANMTGTTVTLTFGQDVEMLEAGKPYIIKWDNDGTGDIQDPVFKGVTVIDTSADDRTITMANGNVMFIGYYDALDITEADDYIYYMTAGNALKHTGTARTLKPCRAYFQFTEAAAARELVLHFGDKQTTDTPSPQQPAPPADSPLYDLQGRPLPNRQFTNTQIQKGIYIHNRKKVVIE